MCNRRHHHHLNTPHSPHFNLFVSLTFNTHIMNNHHQHIITTPTTTPTPPDLQLRPASPDTHHIFRRTLHTSDDPPAWNIQPISTITPTPHHHNPRKKRTKMIQFHNTKPIVASSSSAPSGVVTKKKPDPSAPKITRPCTECGKRFWSWKALFGHMRCHPERPWRGINPPPNIHHPPPEPEPDRAHMTTEEDEYVAACLLMLANTPTTHTSTSLAVQIYDPESRFECSSCKKVFGSHQALGGHRASHKNVKGCFAITRPDAGPEEFEYGEHKCSICLKMFSSGQALGGHKRCHLEKEDVVPTAITTVPSQPFRFDLNSAAPPQDDPMICSSSDLDLRLCL